MKGKRSTIFVFLLICLSTIHLVFALRTNTYFSLDDFAVLNYLQNHTVFEMITQFLSQGDIWGFKKISHKQIPAEFFANKPDFVPDVTQRAKLSFYFKAVVLTIPKRIKRLFSFSSGY